MSILQLTGQEKIYLSSDTFVNEGIDFHDKGEYDKAIASYQRVSKCDPNYGLACYEMALSYYYIDKYEDALAKCKETLSLNYDKAFVHSLMGSILDDMGRPDEGIEILTAALKKWPYNQNLLYNLAACYINTDQPVRAEEILIKSILINPYHTRTHLGLAKANYMMGRITQSYLAYSMVLILNPSLNNVGAFEEVISQKTRLKNQEYKYPYSEDFKSQKWDEIKDLLQSELAFNNDFNYQYEYNYTIGRQSLMLLQKLTFDPSDTSIYNSLYARLFVDIYQKTGFETYLNYILQNVKNENIAKWSAKNQDKLKTFISWAQSFLNQGKLYGFSYQDEQNSKQTYHYDEKGNLASIGESTGKNGDVKKGNWIIIDDDGSIAEKGNYINNKAEGEWLVYWPDGTLKNQLNFVNDNLEGSTRTFYPNGAIENSYNSKTGKKDGAYENYTPSGSLSNKSTFSGGLNNGSGVYYSYNEGFKRTYTYLNDTLEKENIETWLNDHQKTHCSYHKGMLDGAFETWYSNSSKELEKKYRNDTLVGKSFEYYPNNQISKVLEYDNHGDLTGKVITYDRFGKITSEESEYKNGKLTGTRTEFFPDGKNARILTYKDNDLVNVICFDDKGNELYKTARADSSVYLKSFYPDGIMSSEGLLVNSRREGKWKFYNPLGIITDELNYVNGLTDGIQHSYHANGQIEKEYTNSGSYILGEYKEYYINGHLKLDGNYDSTGVAGKWLYYYNNDTVSSNLFYKKGNFAGRAYTFYPNGRYRSEEFYNTDGNSIRYKEFENDGSVSADMKYEYGSHTFEIKFPDGKLKEKLTKTDNATQGLHESYYPNGQLATQIEYSHNLMNGNSRRWDYKGNLTYEIKYILGLAEGECKWYEDNNLVYSAYYEHDNLQGKTTHYYYNGQKSREAGYVDGKRNGNSEYYSPEGILMYRIRYVDNVMKAYSYLDKSGIMIPEILITDKTSRITTYYPNGKVSAVIPLNRGLYEGRFISYYSSGALLRECIYKYGEYDGYDKNYYPNNKLREVFNYVSDNRNGIYEKYFENGKKETSGNYINDDEDGQWKIYNTDGSIKTILTYRYGTVYEIK